MKGFRREPFDFLLPDWSLPDSSDINVLALAREHVDPSPTVSIVTARANQADIVEALSAGADDYVVKPIQDEVLQARVAAVSGRARVLTTPKEFALALLLFRNPNHPLSRSQIVEKVWGSALGNMQPKPRHLHLPAPQPVEASPR